MAKSKGYQGHASWNAWNVSLWINNDESLYRLAKECIKENDTRQGAAEDMLNFLEAHRNYKTPDGAPYSVTTIKAAMREM